jgi:hypothetical protein
MNSPSQDRHTVSFHDTTYMAKPPSLCNPTVVGMFIIIFILNISYSLIAPFLPLEFKRKGADSTSIGLIFR